MLYIIKNLGKGKIGLGERQVNAESLILVEKDPVNQEFSTRLKNQTLIAANWIFNAATGLWEYEFPHVEITVNTEVDITPLNESLEIVNAAEISPLATPLAGKVLLYAKKQPTGNINVNILITKVQDYVV